MRRLLSIAITGLLGFTLAAPLFAIDAAGALPECCRRNGRHHCAGGMNDPSGAAKTISTIAPKCPAFPKAIAAPLPYGFAPDSARSAGIPLFTHPASTPQTEARYRVAYARTRQKRGPPVILL